MCGAAYTQDVRTYKPKIHGVKEVGEMPPIGGRGEWIQDTRGDPYMEESEVGTVLHGYKGVLDF